MPPGDGKLKPEDEIILAVVLSIVGAAILSFSGYKIYTHMKRLKLEQQREQQDLERNGAPPGPGGGGGRGSLVGSEGAGEKSNNYYKKGGLGGEARKGAVEKGWTASNIPRRGSGASVPDHPSRRSDLSDSSSSSGGGGGAKRRYVEIDGQGLSAAANKFELEGSGPPAELPGEPMRGSWTGTGTGTGTVSSTATSRTYGSLAGSSLSSTVSDTTTLFRYAHRPSYTLRTTPVEQQAAAAAAAGDEDEEDRDKGALTPEKHPRLAELHRGASSSTSSSSALRYRDGEVSPLSPAPRSTRTFSLDGTAVEAHWKGGHGDRLADKEAPTSAPAPASTVSTTTTTTTTSGQAAISKLEPAMMRKDKWKVWRALGEETRRKQ